MAADTHNDYPTVLGPDVVIKGELTFQKAVRLQGRLEGSIKTGGRLLVDREAKLQADVRAGSIAIEGEVRGNLTAMDRVELRASADYEGDLQASKLIVEEGAVFKGHVTVGPGVVKASEADAPGISRPEPSTANGHTLRV